MWLQRKFKTSLTNYKLFLGLTVEQLSDYSRTNDSDFNKYNTVDTMEGTCEDY